MGLFLLERGVRAAHDALDFALERLAGKRCVAGLGAIRRIRDIGVPVRNHELGTVAFFDGFAGQVVELRRILAHAAHELHRRQLAGANQRGVQHGKGGFQTCNAGHGLCKRFVFLLRGVRCMVGGNHVNGAVCQTCNECLTECAREGTVKPINFKEAKVKVK